MKINKHILEVTETHELGEWAADILQYVWNNKNRNSLFVLNRAYVSRNGDKHRFKVGVVKDNKFIDITKIVATVTQNKFNLDEFSVEVKGGGMDMGFGLLEQLYMSLSPTRKQAHQAHKLTAVNVYMQF